jgi:hypothetical protein
MHRKNQRPQLFFFMVGLKVKGRIKSYQRLLKGSAESIGAIKLNEGAERKKYGTRLAS